MLTWRHTWGDPIESSSGDIASQKNIHNIHITIPWYYAARLLHSFQVYRGKEPWGIGFPLNANCQS